MCRIRLLFPFGSRFVLALLLAFTASANQSVLSAEPQTSEQGKQEVPEVQLPTDGPGLVEFLRKLSPADLPPERIEQLIAQLGSPRFAEREQASKELVAVGVSALPHLKKALSSTDGEVVRRAQACIRNITPAKAAQGLPLEAVRGLVRLRPPGAVDALLRYLPNSANDESLEEEIWYGLDSLSRDEGKIEDSLLVALKSVVPVKRAAAACIIGHRGAAEQRAEVRKLLADTDPWVRLRAAQGLLAAKDKSGIAVLIALLDEHPVALAWQAEELLHWVAGEDAPEATIGSGSMQRREECRKAWQAWGREHEDKLDLVKLEEEPRRPLLLFMVDLGPREGDCWLCGCDGKRRWQLRNLVEARDIQLLPGDRILAAQGLVRRYVGNPKPQWIEDPVVGITERDLHGKIMWQYTGAKEPAACRRLSTGNTRILAQGPWSVAEVNPAGKRVFFRELPARGDSCAPSYPFILSNGHISYQQMGNPTSGYGEWDFRTGQSVGGSAPPNDFRGRMMDALPNENHLLAGDRVIEIHNGRTVWEYPIQAEFATRLRCGSTVISARRGRGARVVEVDFAGRMVWEVFAQTPPIVHECLALVRLGFDAPYPNNLDLANSIAERLREQKRKDPTARLLSVYGLEEIGAKGGAVIPALIEAVNDPDPMVRSDARRALDDLLRPTNLAAVMQATRDQRPYVRASATWLLWKYADQPNVALPVLLKALEDENPLVRREAASALWHFRSEKNRVVPALMKALKDKGFGKDQGRDWSVGEAAARSLGSLGVQGILGNQANDAVSALTRAARNGDLPLRSSAIRALGYIGSKEKATVPSIVPTLVGILNKDAQMDMRLDAAGALGILGPDAASAVPALRKAVQLTGMADFEIAKRIRRTALSALAEVGPEAKDAVPDLMAILADVTLDYSERQRAAEALGNIGPLAKSAVPALTKVLEDNDGRIVSAATIALQKIQK